MTKAAVSVANEGDACLLGGDGGGAVGESLALPAGRDLLGLLARVLHNGTGVLSEEELHVSRARLVRVNAAVSTECSPSQLLSAVRLDMGDLEHSGVEALGLGAGLGVAEEIEQHL